jgi:hypothetical protein
MSIKVAVRVRPFNEREAGSKVCVKMDGESTCIFNPNDADPEINQRDFTFDYSFWSFDGFKNDENQIAVPDPTVKALGKYADQKAVYDCLGQQVVNNAWEGFNCCLFAYG